MNCKQSLRAASKRIEDLEDFNTRASRDIKAYNQLIDGVIAGQMSFCDWCEDREECQLEAKERGTGCDQCWLMDNPPVKEAEEGGTDDSTGIFSASPDGGV